MTSKNDELSCLAKIIVETIAPDFTELIAEIRTHEFIEAKPFNLGKESVGTDLYKILFTTTDTCVVQRCEMIWNQTRFETIGIALADWDQFFGSWVDEGDFMWDVANDCWEAGMTMYHR